MSLDTPLEPAAVGSPAQRSDRPVGDEAGHEPGPAQGRGDGNGL